MTPQENLVLSLAFRVLGEPRFNRTIDQYAEVAGRALKHGVAERHQSRVVSTGRRNTLAKSLCWRLVGQKIEPVSIF